MLFYLFIHYVLPEIPIKCSESSLSESTVPWRTCRCSPNNHSGCRTAGPARSGQSLASNLPGWRFHLESSLPYRVFLQTKLLGFAELHLQLLQPPLQDDHLLILPLYVGGRLLPQPVQVQLQLHHVYSGMRWSASCSEGGLASFRHRPASRRSSPPAHGLPFMMFFFCSDTASSSMRKSFTRFWYSSTCRHWLSFCSCKCFSIWAGGRTGQDENRRERMFSKLSNVQNRQICRVGGREVIARVGGGRMRKWLLMDMGFFLE